MLCGRHLLGEHAEMHMFLATPNAGRSTAGYIARRPVDPRQLKTRHDQLADKMRRRGYSHHSELRWPPPSFSFTLPYNDIDVMANIAELMHRCPHCCMKMRNSDTNDIIQPSKEKCVEDMRNKQMRLYGLFVSNRISHQMGFNKKLCNFALDAY